MRRMERTKNATNKIYKHRRVCVDVASLNLMAGKVEGWLKAHALVDHQRWCLKVFIYKKSSDET